MKIRLPLLALCLLSVLPLSAESNKDAKPPARDQEARMLHHLLQMEAEELAALRTTIERIERMSPEEKAQLRERLGKLESMPPEHVQAMRERFKAIDPETRDAMRRHWMEMTPEARREWRQKLREMSHEERAKVFEEHSFLPASGKGKKGDPAPRSEDE